jgi:hypothetical protein
MGETTSQVRQDVAQARERLSTEADELELAVRSAIDIPAKIRRSPARVLALGGSAAFLAAGGPKRVARRLAGLVRRPTQGPVESLLPADVQRIVAQVGDGDVQARLERGFADWLEQGRAGSGKGRKRERRTGGEAFWHLFDTVSAPIASRAARRMADRLFAAAPDRSRADETSGGPGGEPGSR